MENSDIILNGSVATWKLPPTQGEFLGTCTGTFKFRCYLSPMEILEAGRDYRAFLGSNASLATETESNVAFALSQLKPRIISSPPFWSSTLQDSQYAGNIPELGIIMLVLEAAMKSESLFKEQIEKEREEVLNRSIKTAENLIKAQNPVEEK